MKIYFNYIKQLFPSKQPTLEQKDDSAQFIKYCLSERTLFVQRFWTNSNQSPSNIETRVMAEDLLLAYDQMLDRIKSHSVKKTDPEETYSKFYAFGLFGCAITLIVILLTK
jgi:hypothetical protein